MNTEAPWPDWLTAEDLRRLKDLSLQFTWMITKEPEMLSDSVYGQWARGLGQEINVALRADGDSLVGVYPRGAGFWPGRSPETVKAETSHTGTFDDVLDTAVTFALAREVKL